MRSVVIVSRVFCLVPWARHVADDPDWLDRRMDLLERVTLPALAEVTTPFVWVWQAHRRKIEQVAGHLARLDTLGVRVLLVDQTAVTAEDVDGDGSLTFRIDTDDAWLPSAIDTTAEREWEDGVLIGFPRGVALDWENKEMRHRTLYGRQGPFLAVTQPRDRMFDTGGNHREAAVGRLVTEVDATSWVQVIHGSNAMNVFPQPSGSRSRGGLANGDPVDPKLRDRILRETRIRL